MTTAAAHPRFFLGWTVVAVALCANFTQVAFFNPTLGVFLPEFEREFGWSRTQISLGITLGSFAGAGLAPLFGPLIDRYGGRRFVVGGAVAMVICLVFFSQMQAEWQYLLLYAIGRGVATGVIALAAGVTVSKWFVRRRGMAIGVMSLGTRLGFALMPIGTQLIIQAADWRTAALALAATVAVFGILPSLRWMHPRPESMGLLPDGDVESSQSSSRRSGKDEYSWSKEDAIHTRAFWLVTLAISLMALTGGAVNLHQIPHLVDRGLSPETAALVITVVAAFGGVGVIAEGFLDARIGARWTLVIGLLGCACGVTILILTHSLATALLFAVVNGFFFGFLIAGGQIVLADYFGRNALGAIRGYSQPFQLGTNAFGPLLGGVAHDLTGSYVAAFVPFALAYVVAAGALAIAKKPRPPAASVQGDKLT